MKKRDYLTLLYSILFLLLAVSVKNAKAERVIPIDEVVNSVNVRELAAPTENNIILGTLSPGQSGEFLESDRHWYKIRLNDGTEGFVSKRWTKIVSEVANNTLEIHFMDVGQGDSTLIICPNGNKILIDAGSLSGNSSDHLRDYILEQIDTTGRQIDTLVITHPDADHYNLIEETLRFVPIERILMVGVEEDYKTTFWNWLTGVNVNEKIVLDENHFDSESDPSDLLNCGDVETYILAASIPANTSRKNAMSIVLMLRYGDVEAILTGDATKATENKIIDRYSDNFLDVDILKIGHHGSLSTSTSKNWANKTKPKLAVASAGERSRFGHPRNEVLERLEPHTINVEPHSMSSATGKLGNYVWEDKTDYTEGIYLTASNGYVIMKTDGQEIDVEIVDIEEIE